MALHMRILRFKRWISEEISAVTKDIPMEEWDYKTIFPSLKRCRAVLFETLRVYPPIMVLPRMSSRGTQTIPVGGRTLMIPPGVRTTVCLKAMQSHPEYWPDPDTWKPSRWIFQTTPAPSIEQGLNEELLAPKPGTYFPGPMVLKSVPGRNFSQVEAVAVLACLFKQHRLIVQKKAHESDEAAQQRALACTRDVNLEALLRMANADKVTLICERV